MLISICADAASAAAAAHATAESILAHLRVVEGERQQRAREPLLQRADLRHLLEREALRLVRGDLRGRAPAAVAGVLPGRAPGDAAAHRGAAGRLGPVGDRPAGLAALVLSLAAAAGAQPPAADLEEALWRRVRDSRSAGEVEGFLRLFEGGAYAALVGTVLTQFLPEPSPEGAKE